MTDTLNPPLPDLEVLSQVYDHLRDFMIEEIKELDHQEDYEETAAALGEFMDWLQSYIRMNRPEPIPRDGWTFL